MTSTLGSRQARGLQRFAVKIRGARGPIPTLREAVFGKRRCQTASRYPHMWPSRLRFINFFWRVAHQALGKIPLSHPLYPGQASGQTSLTKWELNCGSCRRWPPVSVTARALCRTCEWRTPIQLWWPNGNDRSSRIRASRIIGIRTTKDALECGTASKWTASRADCAGELDAQK